MHEVTSFDDTPPPPGASSWLPGKTPLPAIAPVDYDPSWPAAFTAFEARIRAALGDLALGVEHVGSTSVPGMPAKPVIDIDLTVADSSDEDAYVSKLEANGFELLIRESWWLEHRMFVPNPETVPTCHVHVWSPDSPELVRHRIFRDWLRDHEDDREIYRQAKLAAYDATREAGGGMRDYNLGKQDVLRSIYGRAFAALGLT